MLFISLGTVHNQRVDFLRWFSEAFAGLDWHVVGTLGGPAHNGGIGALPPNFEVHPWVPQLAILEHTKVFLSDGGLGGVMSALRQGTPTLLAPEVAERDMDARRVVELGLGQIGQLGQITAEGLRQAVADLAADDATTVRAQQIREHIRAAGGTRRSQQFWHQVAQYVKLGR